MMRSKSSQPIRKIQLDQFDYILIAIGLLALLILVLLPVFAYSDLPERIPTHYNAAGQVDGWGSKEEIFVLPFIGTICFFGILLLTRSPHILNYPVRITEENAEKQYKSAIKMLASLNAIVTIMFAYICYGTVQNALGNMDGLSLGFLPIALAALFGAMGFFIYKMIKQKNS